MSDQYGGNPPHEPDRPGPYQGQGVFGSAGQPGAGNGAHRGPGAGNDPYGGPGPYRGSGPFGAPNQGGPIRPYGQWASDVRPREVTIASVMCFVLGGFAAFLALFAAFSSAEDVAAVMPNLEGAADITPGVLAVASGLCAALYILPAVFVRRRRRWARTMIIVLAGIGIVGGLSALPVGILQLAVHGTLLAMMVRRPTKTWFLRAHP